MVLSTILWDSVAAPNGGAWNDASNWAGGVVPGPGDKAVIDLASSGQVWVSAGGEVESLTVDADTTFILDGGAFSINASANLAGAFTQYAGELTGAGTLNVAGRLTWAGGAMSGAGVTNANGGMTVDPRSADLYLNGRTLNNAGAGSIKTSSNSHSLYIDGDGLIDNLAGASLNFIGGVSILDDPGLPKGGTINNHGTFSISTAGGGIGVAFNNHVDAQLKLLGGELGLGGGGKLAGSILAQSSATLNLVRGDFTAENTSFGGGGQAVLRGGALSIAAGEANFSRLWQAGGELTGPGTLNVNQTLAWTGGTMSGSGVTNAKVFMTIGNPYGGYNKGYNVSLKGRTLNVAGAADITNTTPNDKITVTDGGTINVLPGTTFTLSKVARISGDGTPGSGAFNNQGTLVVAPQPGTTDIGIALNNTGVVKVQNQGTLSLGGGGTASGSATFSVLDASSGYYPAKLVFAGGDFTLGAGTTISSGNTSGAVVFSGGVVNFAGTCGARETTLGGGVLNLTGSPTWYGNFTQTGGELTGPGTLNVNGGLFWTGGIMSGSGVTNANRGMTIAPTAGALDLVGRTLNNAASAQMSGSPDHPLRVSNGGTIINSPNANFRFTGAAISSITNGGDGGGTFGNQGYFTIDASTAGADIGIALNNAYSIDVRYGTLKLGGGGTNLDGAVLSARAGAKLEFAGGDFTTTAGSQVGGRGAFVFSGGAVNIAGTYAVDMYSSTGGTTVRGGVVNLTGPDGRLGGLTITAGVLNLSGPKAQPAQAGAYTQTGGELTGTGELYLFGDSVWAGGTMTGAGATTVYGGLVIGGAASATYDLKARTLNNLQGAIALTTPGGISNRLRLSDGARLNNQSAIQLADGDAIIAANGGAAGEAIFNSGTISKAGGTGESQILVPLNNSGVVRVDAGALSLRGGGKFTSAGSAMVADGATLEFHSALYTLNDGAVVQSDFDKGVALLTAGTLSIPSGSATIYNLAMTGGELAVDGDAITGNFTMTGGALTGAGALDVYGNLAWTDGTMSGTGATNVRNTMTIAPGAGTALKDLSGRTLNNQGATTLGAGDFQVSNGGTINNLAGATFTLGRQAVIEGSAGSGTFDNQGTLRKVQGDDESVVRIKVNNSGVVRAEAGRFRLEALGNYAPTTRTLTGGTYFVSSTLVIDGADIATNAADVTLSGIGAKIVDAGDNDAFRGLAANAAGASLTLRDGGNLIAPGTFTNAGNLTIQTGNAFSAGGAYNQSGGITHLDRGGSLSASGGVNINGGSLGGAGDINGDVVNNASVVPGRGGYAGNLSINGDYAQTAAGALTIDLRGPEPETGYAQLRVSGRATLDGTLRAPFVGGFAPAADATFEVVAYGSKAGAFAAITTQNPPAGLVMSHEYQTDALVLKMIVPAVVTGTSISWGSKGMAALQTAADGLRLLPAGRSKTIGWLGINRISITLDKAATLTAADVTVASRIGADYGPVTVAGSGTSWLITLAKPLNVADRVTIAIGGGELAMFTRRLDVLPGDVNDDGAVTTRDALFIRNGIKGIAPQPFPVKFLDILGEGVVTMAGYNTVRRFIGSRLP